MKQAVLHLHGQVRSLLFGREQAHSGRLHLRLSEHDSESLDDQSAESEYEQQADVNDLVNV